MKQEKTFNQLMKFSNVEDMNLEDINGGWNPFKPIQDGLQAIGDAFNGFVTGAKAIFRDYP